MDSVLDGGGQLEREMRPDPLAASATGSIVLHAVLFGGILFYGFFNGFLHHSWGNPGPGSAIQVSLDSASIPLPSDQPKNDNVLPSEKPSPAPAPPEPKAKEAVDQTAIPIQGKEKKPEKQKQEKTAKVLPPQPQNRLQYGEQAGSKLSRSTFAQTATADQPVSVSNGDFGSRYPWYVDGIKRKVSQNWNRYQVDQSTQKGAVSEIYFKVNRQGIPSNFRVNKSSGSQTLDRSCLLATQRVDTFGDLPSQANDQYLDVTYDCTY
jgi:periplasmic protein TonB